jgi:CheY-like chemotaxis protein
MMRLLIVENNASFEANLRGGLATVANLAIAVAHSREEAVNLINGQEFDLILCDLRIPTAVGRLDEAVEHGLAVYNHAQGTAPGTPIVVMSAYGTLDIIRSLYQAAPRDDPFGVRSDTSMTEFFKKSELLELVQHVDEVAGHREALDAIGINTGGVDFGLSVADRTVLRLFCRRNGGVLIRLNPLQPGLSAARVIRVEVRDEHGAITSRALAKLASYAAAADEAERFQQFVAPQLASGAFAHLIDHVKAGACRTAGLFYWFAGGGDPNAYNTSLLELLAEREDLALLALDGLKEKLRPWVAAAHQEEMSVQEIRQLLLPDPNFAVAHASLPPDVDRAEGLRAHVNRGPEHGDLHGYNVLVRAADSVAVLIDFGSLMSAPIALDPMTLELSLLFHPDSPFREGDWPTSEQARSWCSIDDFVDGSPVEQFVRRCREWAYERCASDKEIYAVAYAYATRQLKYPGTDHERATALAGGAVGALLEA